MANISAPPDYLLERDQITNAVTDLITVTFRKWLLSVTDRVQANPQVVKHVALTLQSAAIGATPLDLGVVAPGAYRLTYYTRIMTPGSINSSVTVTLNWTDGGVVQTFTGAAMTGNLTTTTQTGTLLVVVDQATTISYSVAYASNAAGMQYSVTVIAEQIP